MDGSQAAYDIAQADRQAAVGTWLDALPLNSRHWMVFAVCSIAFLFDGFDFQIVALAMPYIGADWTLSAGTTGWVLAATPIGMLIGTVAFGALADRFGRRTSFQLTVGMFAVFSAACAFAQSPGQLIALRVIAGIGIGGFLPVDNAVMTEFMPAPRRGLMMGLWAICFSVGLLIAAQVSGWIIPAFGWRSLLLLGGTPAIMILAMRAFVPETPRFLLAHGRVEEARRSIVWVSRGRICPSIEALCAMPPPRTAARLRLADLFSPDARMRTAVAWAMWFFWSFSYFGLLLWLPKLLGGYKQVAKPDVFLFMTGFILAGIGGRIIASAIVDQVGRKAIIVVCGLAAAGCMLMFGRQETLPDLMLWGFALAFFHDPGLGAIATYSPELFPTRARATGVGSAAGVGRIGAFLAPVMVGQLVDISLLGVFACFAASFVLAAVSVAVLGRETARRNLEAATEQRA